MCSVPEKTKKVLQTEPVSLFGESREEADDKVDFTKLDITQAVQHGATQRFYELLEAGISHNTGRKRCGGGEGDKF